MSLQRAGKQLLKKALMDSGSLTVASRVVSPGAVILMYHSITEDPRLSAWSIGVSQPRAAFEAHIRAIAERFNAVSIDEVTEFASGRRRLPKKSVAVTFDDGFADNHDVVLPILTRYSVPATFYLLAGAIETGAPPWYCRIRHAFGTTKLSEWTDSESGMARNIESDSGRVAALDVAFGIGARKTGSIQEQWVSELERSLEIQPLRPESRFMMTWDQARALKQAKHTIGAHTLTHPNLTHVTKDEARWEITGSKAAIEKALGEPVRHFSYPHPALDPEWNAETVEITRESGFRSAVVTASGRVRAGDDPLELRRIYAAAEFDQWLWNLECTFLGRAI